MTTPLSTVRNVWTDNLSIAVVPTLVALGIKEGPFTLHYTKSTWAGRAFKRCFQSIGLLGRQSTAVELTGHGEHVNDSHSEAFRIQALINEFSSQFAKRHGEWLSTPYPDSRVKPARVTANLKNIAATFIYQLLVFTSFARYWHGTHGEPVGELTIVSHNAVLANSISKDWAGSDVRFICPWSWQHSLLVRFAFSGAQWIFESRRPKRRAPRGPYTVASTVHQLGLDPSVYISDIHWWWGSTIPADRVILCFDQPYLSAKKEIVARAEKLGLRCVAFKPSAVGDSPHLLWRRAPGPLTAVVRFGRKLKALIQGMTRPVVGQWVSCRFTDMLYTSERIEDFMREFNVRAFFHYQDADSDYVSLACDVMGGARIGYEWSNYHWPSATHIRAHQVYFCWGPRAADIVKELDSCVDFGLYSGCVVKNAKPGLPLPAEVSAAAGAIRQRGASRILALFDTSLPCEAFYEYFLTRVLEDSRFGFLIKPKLPDGLTRLPPNVKALYTRALATGRIYVFENSLSPAEVAGGADISVGIDVNSAIVVSALAEHRAIQLDRVRMHKSPLSRWASFYNAGPDRLVFDNPDLLWKALNDFFDNPKSQPQLGVVDESLLTYIDPFRDAKASERIGFFVATYLEGMDSGLRRDAALGHATTAYAKKWGAAAVWCQPEGTR